ncbi:RHS repeat-associated core domain-containing protein [Streptomyces bohaiensis]|uniref:RHS repeat domain-containing protein n=1 Tax=Streptomyces bohaiensis TaxID=1431344 RepID=UPI003B764BA9
MTAKPRWPRRLTATRRATAGAVATVLLAGLVQAVSAPTAVGDQRTPDVPQAEEPVGSAGELPVLPRHHGETPPAPVPAPEGDQTPPTGTADVTLAGPGSGPLPTRAGDLPVTLGSVTAPAAATVEMHDLAERTEGPAGDGALVVIEARPTGPTASTTPAVGAELFRAGAGAVGDTLRADVTVDYSSFARAHGGGYASRLTLSRLPGCAAETPEKAECATAEPLEARNDTTARTLTVTGLDLPAGEPVVLLASSEAESEEGDWAATDLAASSAWETDLNTGDFTWSHPFPVPEVPGGLQPSLGLGYSSGSIDGRTGGSNNQGSWVGDGFHLWPGYIERKYESCAVEEFENSDGHAVHDLCWDHDNAHISFNGIGGELVPDGADRWKLQSDDGTVVDRLRSTARGNGDNDGEYWRLTDPEGTRYYFGYHRLPGWSAGRDTTDSTWTVPVYGNDRGEPCHNATAKDAWCQQGWRWNLDYVVDTRGNAAAYYYTKEENSYSRFLDTDNNTRYTRGGSIDRIEYGLHRDTVHTQRPLAKVLFTGADRCLAGGGADCSDIREDSRHWYDTPWDLNCDKDEECDTGRYSPTFWTTERLAKVTTQILTPDGHRDVDSWQLRHRWGTADVNYQLLLTGVQHTGHTAAAPATLPATTFAYEQLPNRLDRTGDGYAPFIKARVSSVADEAGGQIDVGYSAPACTTDSTPTPHTNTTRCFPQYLGGGPDHDAELHWFNKYVVESVTATDRTGGAPDQVTRYQYLGGGAWHYDDDNGLVPEDEKTWSVWRGYGHVRVTTGGQTSTSSQEDHYFLRGMHGDRLSPSGGTRAVTVALGAGEGTALTDHRALAGFAYRTVTFDAPGGKVLERTVSRPWSHRTARSVRDWGTLTSDFVDIASRHAWTSLDAGAGERWRTTDQYFTYDTVAGRVTTEDIRGDSATTADDQCTRTSYATDTPGGILTAVSREETVAGRCSLTPDRARDVTADVRYAYDGKAFGAAPTHGDVTATAVLHEHDGTTGTYIESATEYDRYGRVVKLTDITGELRFTGTDAPVRTARDDGLSTTTVHSPATGIPVTVTETTPPAVAGDATTAQRITTTLDPRRPVAVRTTDTNNRTTHAEHDAFGRLTKVWFPDRTPRQLPSTEYVYRLAEGRPAAVGTRTIGNRGVQDTSWVLYDGLLRERQSQTPGPDGGRLIADTFYDERGLTAKTFADYYADGPPSATLFQVADESLVESQTRHTHDGLGRETVTRVMAGDGDGGRELSVTRAEHLGDRSVVVPPEGGTTTTTIMNALGEVAERRHHHDRSPDSAYDATHYAYDAHGRLASVTDAEDNVWRYEYDLIGNETAVHDPVSGTRRSTYDERGLLRSSTDGRGTTLVREYDGIGRATALRRGDADGPLLAEWEYDTVTGAIGQQTRATRWHEGNAYISENIAFDSLYRPIRTRVTIPESEGALAGSYVSSSEYEPSGVLRSVGLPAAGSLPGQNLTFGYEDGTLRPVTARGPRGIAVDTRYSLTGKPQQFELSAAGGKKTWATNTYEWGTQFLTTTRVERADQPGVDRHETYRYDQVGNVLSVSDVGGGTTDTQCFTYDHLRRLTEAWTEARTACAADGDAATVAGPAPYHHSYAYDPLGNRTAETDHEAGLTRAYHYDVDQPYAVAAVEDTGSDGTTLRREYGYDAAGNTVTRDRPAEDGTVEQTLTWNAEGRVSEVDNGDGSGTTRYVYDTANTRLISRTEETATLYLGHTQVTVGAGSDTATATRYLDLGGGHQAVVADDGTVSFTLADHHATGHLAVDAEDHTVVRRRTLPFGGVRGEAPEDWPGTRAFVGATDDTEDTGLLGVGAREYDAELGRFLSADPVLDISNPQQMHGYSYAYNNPLAFTDPTGLFGKSLGKALKKIGKAIGKAVGKAAGKSAGKGKAKGIATSGPKRSSGGGKGTVGRSPGSVGKGKSGGVGWIARGSGGIRGGGASVFRVSHGGRDFVPAPWETETDCNALCQFDNLGFVFCPAAGGGKRCDPQAIGGWWVTYLFAAQRSPDVWLFTEGDKFTEEMRKTKHIEEVRERLSTDLHGAGPGTLPEKEYDYRSKDLSTSRRFGRMAQDFLGITTGLGNNAETIGSYSVFVHVESIDHDAGTATVVFRVRDRLNRESAFRDPINGYDKDTPKSTDGTEIDVRWRETITLK